MWKMFSIFQDAAAPATWLSCINPELYELYIVIVCTKNADTGEQYLHCNTDSIWII